MSLGRMKTAATIRTKFHATTKQKIHSVCVKLYVFFKVFGDSSKL